MGGNNLAVTGQSKRLLGVFAGRLLLLLPLFSLLYYTQGLSCLRPGRDPGSVLGPAWSSSCLTTWHRNTYSLVASWRCAVCFFHSWQFCHLSQIYIRT